MRQSYPVSGAMTFLANAIATAACEKLSLEEQNVWGNLLTLVGAAMLSIAAINEAVSKASGSEAADSPQSAGQRAAGPEGKKPEDKQENGGEGPDGRAEN